MDAVGVSVLERQVPRPRRSGRNNDGIILLPDRLGVDILANVRAGDEIDTLGSHQVNSALRRETASSQQVRPMVVPFRIITPYLDNSLVELHVGDALAEMRRGATVSRLSKRTRRAGWRELT